MTSCLFYNYLREAALPGTDDHPILRLDLCTLIADFFIINPHCALPHQAAGLAVAFGQLGEDHQIQQSDHLHAGRQNDLRKFIRAEKARAEDVTCLIAADASVDHGKVVWLIDLVKQEGVAKFAININPEVAQPPASMAPAGDEAGG